MNRRSLFIAVLLGVVLLVFWQVKPSAGDQEELFNGLQQETGIEESPSVELAEPSVHVVPERVSLAADQQAQVSTQSADGVGLEPELKVVPLFHGRIVDSETKKPLEGVRLTLLDRQDLGPGQSQGEEIDVTDSDGRFDFRFIKGDSRVCVVANLQGYGVCGFSADDEHTDPGDPVVITMTRAARLIVRMEGGDWFGTAKVQLSSKARYMNRTFSAGLYWGAGTHFRDPRWTLRLSSSGTSEIEVPAGSPLTLSYILGGVTQVYPDVITLEPGEVREVVWKMGSGVRIHGRLVDDQNQPIASAVMWLSNKQMGSLEEKPWAYYYANDSERLLAKTRTHSDGRFEFEDVAPGIVGIGPAAKERSFSSSKAVQNDYCRVATRIEVPLGVSDLQVDLVAPRGLKIAGRVIQADGTPYVMLLVHLYSEEGSGRMMETLDEEGRFELGPLMPGSHVLGGHSIGDGAAPEPLTVQAGDLNVVIEMETGNLISGVVLDSRPVKGERVWVKYSLGPGPGASMRSTRSDGSFELKGLGAGEWTLVATAEDGRIAIRSGLSLDNGTHLDNVELRLVPGATVRIGYTGPAVRAKYTIALDGAFVTFGTVLDKTEEKATIPVGPCTIEMKTPDGKTQVREVDLLAGEELLVEFDLHD
ncbi:MAG: carboxypeptidase regulatory-like domain-containing protein [Planctomycetes bacterium]|nr:carboxypeptidase regulatory-like domain-containing protein [Planctomycetota bacterium]